MNDAELVHVAVDLLQKTPPAPKVPRRSFLSWQINDALFRMQSSPDPAVKLKWAKVLNDARRERGDFDHIAKPAGELPRAAGSEAPNSHNHGIKS